MAIRKLGPEQFRNVVRSRLTKGDAFMLSAEDYTTKQAQVKAMLDGMTVEEIQSAYSYVCYDITA